MTAFLFRGFCRTRMAENVGCAASVNFDVVVFFGTNMLFYEVLFSAVVQ